MLYKSLLKINSYSWTNLKTLSLPLHNFYLLLPALSMCIKLHDYSTIEIKRCPLSLLHGLTNFSKIHLMVISYLTCRPVQSVQF